MQELSKIKWKKLETKQNSIIEGLGRTNHYLTSCHNFKELSLEAAASRSSHFHSTVDLFLSETNNEGHRVRKRSLKLENFNRSYS